MKMDDRFINLLPFSSFLINFFRDKIDWRFIAVEQPDFDMSGLVIILFVDMI